MINRRHIRVKVMQSVYAMITSKSDDLVKEEKFTPSEEMATIDNNNNSKMAKPDSSRIIGNYNDDDNKVDMNIDTKTFLPTSNSNNRVSSINLFLENSYKYLRQIPFIKRQRKGVKATAKDLAALVYIKNMKVKNKTIEKFTLSKVPISCSWNEGKLKRALKDPKGKEKVRNYTGKQMMRV